MLYRTRPAFHSHPHSPPNEPPNLIHTVSHIACFLFPSFSLSLFTIQVSQYQRANYPPTSWAPSHAPYPTSTTTMLSQPSYLSRPHRRARPVLHLIAVSDAALSGEIPFPNAGREYRRARAAVPANAFRLKSIQCRSWIAPSSRLCTEYSGVSGCIQREVWKVSIPSMFF